MNFSCCQSMIFFRRGKINGFLGFFLREDGKGEEKIGEVMVF